MGSGKNAFAPNPDCGAGARAMRGEPGQMLQSNIRRLVRKRPDEATCSPAMVRPSVSRLPIDLVIIRCGGRLPGSLRAAGMGKSQYKFSIGLNARAMVQLAFVIGHELHVEPSVR